MTVAAGFAGQVALRVVLESVLAPLVAKDGGELRWVGRTDDIVEVSLTGACEGCPAQRDTLDTVLLPVFRAADPTITAVRVVRLSAPPG